MTTLADLKDTVTKLNESTELINQELALMEDTLAKIGPGVVAWIVDENDSTKKFGYYRFHNGWHLAIKHGDEEPQEVLRAARYYRLAVFNRFDKIVEALNLTCKALSEKMEKATKPNLMS